MDFPDEERVVYERNPLVEVVCQLRFPRALEIDQSIPAAFQRGVSENFPLTETRETAKFSVGVGAENKPPTHQTIYDFTTKDRDYTLSLCSDFIALKTSNYSCWGDFFALLEIGMQSLRSNYTIHFYSRLGVRYINLIDRDDLGLGNSSWESLIRPSALGLLGDPDVPHGSIAEQGAITVIKLKRGQVAIRNGINFDGETDNKRIVIDSDFFCEEQIERDEDACKLLAEYNHCARNAFRWFIRPPLHEALGPKEN
ncbi:TIGR04255 family protein [Leisingera caerulea]|uniref:TIGR04255 family protein n=1 Tax=Leisingera caerulea TaxID=506591 RepID=UPI0021A56AD6|nr:TIGR04255 family protein [Leisingera caerulea]UWQ83532.1 TIGR04255 family protein [Leisingera caerulea]